MPIVKHYGISDKIKTELQEKCKVICFTRDDPKLSKTTTNKILYRGFVYPRMWAQYANNHTGVCLVFDKIILSSNIRRIYEGSVKYTKRVGYINAFSLDCEMIDRLGSERFIKYHIKKYYKTLLFEKLQDWKSKLEYRWILVSPSTNYEYFSVLGAIKGIVLGVDFPEKYVPQVVQCSREFKVPVIQLDWHNGYPTPLTL